MLVMQRRNVNWVIKPKNQVQKTWGVTHVLLIMEEVLLSKVLNIMEKLVEVGVGGGGYEGSEYFGCHNKVFLILP